MLSIKCPSCGGTSEIDENLEVGTCAYCGSKFAISKNFEKIGNLLNQATYYRQQSEFDKAIQTYEDILRENYEDADAHFGLMLSKYGVEYVEDPVTHVQKPTCHRTKASSVLEDFDYQKAIEYADMLTRDLYRTKAEEIDAIQQKIIQVSKEEEKYDIFISFKDTDEFEERTEDSVIAQELYTELTKKGYRVFFSRKTLENRLGEEFEPIIFSALSSAKVLIVLGTKPEYFQAVWVKNEWSRFLEFKDKDSSKIIIPCYKRMSPYDLPRELTPMQSQNMEKIGFMQELCDRLDVLLKRNSSGTATPTNTSSTANTEDTIKRLCDNGETFLNLENYAKAKEVYEKVANEYPNDYRGWYGLIKVLSHNLKEFPTEARREIGQYENYLNKVIKQEEKQQIGNDYNNYIAQCNDIVQEENRQKQAEAQRQQQANERNHQRQRLNDEKYNLEVACRNVNAQMEPLPPIPIKAIIIDAIIAILFLSVTPAAESAAVIVFILPVAIYVGIRMLGRAKVESRNRDKENQINQYNMQIREIDEKIRNI